MPLWWPLAFGGFVIWDSNFCEPFRERSVVSQLRALLAQTSGAPTMLREHTTIEVPVEYGPRTRALDADQEILDTCLDFVSGGTSVILVTDDTGRTDPNIMMPNYKGFGLPKSVEM